MGFVSWVGGLLSKGAGKLTDAIAAIIHAFQVLWNLVRAIGRNVGHAWRSFYRSATNLVSLIESLAASTYRAVSKIVTHTIPDAIRNTLRAAISEAAKLANTVKAWAVSAYRASLSFAARIVAELRHWTGSAVRWLTGLISELRATLGYVARIVSDLLTHPDRLVAWILPTLVKALFRLAVASTEVIARLILGQGVRLILQAVPRIEAVLADIL